MMIWYMIIFDNMIYDIIYDNIYDIISDSQYK